MRHTITRVALWGLALGALAWGSAGLAGPFKVAAVQTTAGRIGGTQNLRGYQLRLGVTPLRSGATQLATKKFTLHLGLFAEAPAGRSGARYWVFYE